MRQFQSEGVAYCSLSAIPMLRCDHGRKGDSLIVRGTCMIWWRYCNFLYDMQGIYHFKSRFRPEYREIYIVAYEKASILSLIAMGRVWGIIKVSPFRMISKLYQQVSKSRTRKNLAPPDVRPERVMRKLARPNTQPSLANTSDRSVAPTARIEADRQPIAAIAEQAHAS
jgi:phosphatidylglycerol lysyltransferase